MIRAVVVFTLAFGLALTSALTENDDSSLRFFGGIFGGYQLGLMTFCEKANEWLASSAANVAVTNGTVPSMQEIFVDFLTTLCSNTRSDISLVDQKLEERHGGWGHHGWGTGGGHPLGPNRTPLSYFCGRTEAWIQSEGADITASNETTSTMQQVFVDFLTAVCDGVTRDVRRSQQEREELTGVLAQVKRWFYHPRPQSPFEVFCKGTNQWLSNSGVNVTAITGTGDNLPAVFVDFLTNICDNTRRSESHDLSEDTDKGNQRFFWPFMPNPNGCLGEFCDETNNWLQSTTLNITSSSSGTALSPLDLFINFLESICDE